MEKVSHNTSIKRSIFKGSSVDIFFHILFIIATSMSIVAVAGICYFIFSSSAPAINKVGLWNFISGTVWKPTAVNHEFGILPMIVASIYVTLGATVLGVPVGIFAAVFMSFYCPKKLYPILQGGINLLAGIPSVVYGLWALTVIVPWIRETFGGYGTSLLAAIILLAIMILPTIITLSESALQQVPQEYYDGAVGIGASHERAVFSVMLPAAKSGVLSAVILGIGRAIGETMAVKMVAGNQPIMPASLIQGARTLTANIVMEMNYAQEGLHRDSLIATGAVLFVFILIINLLFRLVKKKDVVE